MTDKKKISVVIAVHDQEALLEQNLPRFLTVAGETDAEVIVVDDMSSDDTPNILKRMRSEYQQLYTTFLPVSSVLNPSRLRLALNVGVKAAKGDYVVIADISRPPLSATWLLGLADGGAALVYSSRKGNHVTHLVADDLDDLQSAVLKAERKSGRGHKGRWQKRRRGLYDAIGIRRENVHRAVMLFDQPLRGWALAWARMKVLFQ
jgi:hypothetical protein